MIRSQDLKNQGKNIFIENSELFILYVFLLNDYNKLAYNNSFTKWYKMVPSLLAKGWSPGKKIKTGKKSSAYIPAKPASGRQNLGTQSQTSQVKPLPKQSCEPRPGIRLSASDNPGGNGDYPGGGPSWEEWNEINLVPPEEDWKSDPNYWENSPYNPKNSKKKKKLDEEVCSTSDQLKKVIVEEKFNQYSNVKSFVESALKNQILKREYAALKINLEKGTNPVEIGNKSTAVGHDKVLIKKGNGRYLVQVSVVKVEILGLCARSGDVQTFATLMNGTYGTTIQY